MKHTFPVGLALVVASFASHAQQYDIYDLGPVGGSISTVVNGINNRSVVVGSASFDIFGGSRPAIFKTGMPPEPIYTPSYGEATAINDRGDVVGFYIESSTTYGFVTNKDIVKTIPSVEGKDMLPLAINNKGEIVGISRGCCDGLTGAWVYRDGKLIDMGTLGGISAAFTSINNRGDILGTRSTADGGDAFILSNGKIKSILPTLNTSSATPKAINNRGDVVGYFNGGAGAVIGFAIINNKPYRIEFGQYLSGHAVSINDSGQVAGWHYRRDSTYFAGFIWEKGRITDIQDLPDVKAAGWKVIWDARAINNEGVVFGTGFRDFNKWHGYMLVPRKEYSQQQ